MKVLKVLLVIFLILQVLGNGLVFFAFLPRSIFLALLFLFLAVLQITLTAAVIRHCGELEEIWDEIFRLRGAVRGLQKIVEPYEETAYPAVSSRELAQNTWECVKCAAVNKADTTRCSHCGAAYAAAVNPTDDPSVKRVLSRWVKEEKKRRLFGRKPKS